MDFNYIVCCYYKLKADGIIRVIIDFMIRPFSFHHKNRGLRPISIKPRVDGTKSTLFPGLKKILQEGYFFLIQEKKK